MQTVFSPLKNALRQKLHLENARHSYFEKQQGSKALLDKVIQLPAWLKAKTVLLYAPLDKEPNLLDLLNDQERRFVFPRMEGRHLKLYYWLIGASWVMHRYGIKEPDPKTWEEASLSSVDIAFIPGVGFDQQGGRLGWGKGYYDRLFHNRTFMATKVGCAWPWQLIPQVPLEAHDMMMDQVLVGD